MNNSTPIRRRSKKLERLRAKFLRAITRRYPLNSPRASILRRLPSIPQDYGEIRGKQGIWYHAYWPTADEVSRSLFWFGDFDPWVNAALLKFAKPGSAALDIGANIGASAIPLAKAVGSQGRVVCFEPLSSNVAFLKKNIAANKLTWVRVEALALSNQPGELSMTFAPDCAGKSRVSHSCVDLMTERVSALRFDDWLSAQETLDISVCKIDVEGHEPQVFAGMARTLVQRLIPAFVFERHIGGDVRSDPILELLRRSDYRIFRISKSPLRTFYSDLDESHTGRPTNDFVAILPHVNLKEAYF